MQPSASAGRVASAVLDPRRWWALALLCGAFFMVLPDGTITTVALLAALALSPVLLRESRAALTRRSYDPAGALTITGALVLVVCAVIEAPGAWGDVRTILPLAQPSGRRLRADRVAPPRAAGAAAHLPLPGPGGRCRCRRRRGDQVRNEMSEQRTDSYHPRRLRRR